MKSLARRRLPFVLSDYATANLGWLAFNVVRYYSLPPTADLPVLPLWLFHDPHILLGQLLFPLMMVCLYAVSGYYNSPGLKSRIDIAGNTATVSLAGMLIIFFTVLLNDNVPERLYNYQLMLILWLLLAGPTMAGRTAINQRLLRRRRRGEGLIRALIVGTDSGARRLARKITTASRGTDFDIVAHMPHDATGADIAAALTAHAPNAIIIAGQPSRSLIADLFATGLDIYISPENYTMLGVNPRIRAVASEPLINISQADVPPSTANLKRLGDIIASAFALLLLSPVLAFIAVAIRRDSRGPVFYTQERIGYRKRPFRIIKFRTMAVDAEADGPSLSSEADPRITAVGRVLRKYRLDELPQFWNVLRGEMSLVGPRPEREFFARQIVMRAPQYNLIHQVRPGITSWGMVKFGYASSVDQMVERLRYDMLYLENVSLSVDLKILFYTVNTVITGRGL